MINPTLKHIYFSWPFIFYLQLLHTTYFFKKNDDDDKSTTYYAKS